MRSAIFGALLLWTAPAAAADWHLVNLGRSGALRSVSYIDLASMRRRGRIVRYWIDQRFNQSADPTGHPANRFVQLQEANCVERTRRMVSGDAYLGDVYVMPMKPTGDWKYLAPDTNGYVEVERVCARKWGRDSIASDRLGAVASAYFDSRR